MIRNNKTFKAWIAIAIVIAILLIDQIIKIEVKTNMTLGEAKRVTDWFYIEFIENNGMAYGMKFINKLVLSLFRLFAIGFIGYYLAKIIKKNRINCDGACRCYWQLNRLSVLWLDIRCFNTIHSLAVCSVW